MKRRAISLLIGMGFLTLIMLSPTSCQSQKLSQPAAGGTMIAQQQAYLTPEEYAVLDEMFRVHMNYLLSPEVITAFGFPMTAYKVGNRARFGYSNPTEWGYAWQAWIAAAERRIISEDEATSRLKRALTTLEALQQNPKENYQGLPYPFYKMTTPDGKDLPAPYHDPYPEIPSGDNALLYASLVIVEGWGRKMEMRSYGNRPSASGSA